MSDRRADLTETLNLLQEQLSGQEKALALAPLEDKVRLKQKIAMLRQEITEVKTELQQVAEQAGVQLGESKGVQPKAQQGASQRIYDTGTGFQANQPQGPVVQGEGNSIVVNYYGGEEAGKQNRSDSQAVSRVQQLRHDRLRRQWEQYEVEYTAVADQLAGTIDPSTRVRLERQLNQLEAKMAKIEAELEQ